MTISTDYSMNLVDRPARPMQRGVGSLLWDDQGKRYVDFVQGWAVNCLGHAPPVLVQALEAQLARVINVGPAYRNEPALALAEGLAGASGLGRVFLASSGAEANEGAVKLARKWGQKHRHGAHEVLTAKDSFHGRTLAMTCATGKEGFDRAFPPAVPGFRKVPYGDLEALESAIQPQTVGVMLEPIQGEAGVVVPPSAYLREVRALCDRHGVLLIADEVQTGMGRTGPLFGYQAEGIRPDILTLGKGLGGGLPVSAVLAREEVACFERGDHGSTFTGNALLCAGALAVFEVLSAPEHEALRAASAASLEAALQSVAGEHGAQLRGRGHLWGMVLPEERAIAVRDRAFAEGLLVNAARPHVLRFMPALDVSAEHIAEMADLLRRALRT